ncbi:MAG: hypothetical protein CM15mP77_2300 [Synechococcus sp.]|nr:MAG: hypothetical protein CM15mP77_2300 [Synechococcus sp.]
MITEALDEGPSDAACPPASTTRTTGNRSCFATAAVLPASLQPMPSNSPMTPHQGQIPLTPITVKGLFNPGLSAEIDVEIAAGMPCCSTQSWDRDNPARP